jgi:PAS domain S-box-containing protein
LAVLDITALKQAQAALQQANDALEQRVANRTAELEAANAELCESRRAAFNLMEEAQAARQQAEHTAEALRASEERYRTVAEFTYDWEYWRTTDNQFLYVSPSCERITGYTAAEFIADPGLYPRIVHPEDRARVVAHLQEDLLTSAPCELEFRIVRRDGEILWIGHACQAVNDPHGRLVGRRAANRDITARKRAEESLRASNQELEEFNQAMVGRELRMIELKQEINDACARLGEPPRYELEGEEELPA